MPMDLRTKRALGLGAAAGAAAALLACRRRDAHLVRCLDGVGIVSTHRIEGVPVRVLRLGGVWQSATYLGDRWAEPVFAYYRAFDAVFDAGPAFKAASGHAIAHALMIGGGGFAWPKHALTAHPELSLTVVEHDPAIVSCARRWFYLDRLEEEAAGDRLEVTCDDGRAFLEKTDERFDAILNDAFSGSEPVRSLATVEAARAVKARLVPGGIYAANVVSEEGGEDVTFLRDVVATLAQVFSSIEVLSAEDETYGGEDNYLVVATDLALSLPGAIAFDEEFLGTILSDDD
ncbi:MAG: spermidine synthase [Atopobiaceae bacterium]